MLVQVISSLPELYRPMLRIKFISSSLYLLVGRPALAATGRILRATPDADLRALLAALRPGDMLLLANGTYANGIQLGQKHAGTAERYITIRAEHPGQAVLSGERLPRGRKQIVRLDGASFVRLEGLAFRDAHGNGAAGVSLGDGCHHVIVADCTFEDIDTPDPGTEDHTANGVIAYGTVPDAPIHDILVFRNTFRHLRTGWGECISFGENCENINIVANLVEDTGNIGIDVSGNYGDCPAADRDFVRHAYIARNTVRDCVNRDYGDTCYGIYADGAQHVQIVSNLVERCMGGIEVGAERIPPDDRFSASDILVRGNTIRHCTEQAIACGGWNIDASSGDDLSGWVRRVRFVDNALQSNAAGITLFQCAGIELLRTRFDAPPSSPSASITLEFESQGLTRDIRVSGSRHSPSLQ